MLTLSYCSLDIYQNDVSVNILCLSQETRSAMSREPVDATGILNPYAEVRLRIKSMKTKTFLRGGKKMSQIPEDIMGASIQPCLKNISLGFCQLCETII